jgi:hypothetical protein
MTSLRETLERLIKRSIERHGADARSTIMLQQQLAAMIEIEGKSTADVYRMQVPPWEKIAVTNAPSVSTSSNVRATVLKKKPAARRK